MPEYDDLDELMNSLTDKDSLGLAVSGFSLRPHKTNTRRKIDREISELRRVKQQRIDSGVWSLPDTEEDDNKGGGENG